MEILPYPCCERTARLCLSSFLTESATVIASQSPQTITLRQGQCRYFPFTLPTYSFTAYITYHLQKRESLTQKAIELRTLRLRTPGSCSEHAFMFETFN